MIIYVLLKKSTYNNSFHKLNHQQLKQPMKRASYHHLKLLSIIKNLTNTKLLMRLKNILIINYDFCWANDKILSIKKRRHTFVRIYILSEVWSGRTGYLRGQINYISQNTVFPVDTFIPLPYKSYLHDGCTSKEKSFRNLE